MATSKADEILDAAERRIREAGYNGFSFRDLAADVGIRSASVHHHFPTKAALAAAVARRYADRFLAALEPEPPDRIVAAWRAAFRHALREDGRMCLCGVLGAEAGALPPEVAAEARRFFQRGAECLAGNTPDDGLRILATLEGAMLVARTLGDPDAFDRATATLA
ncbi:TetR/AcrR family transcriptional regulator [Roseomonas sp. CCTCC AB2023176]|uniref:TetR/AcrR family transcriptional regulator n=1 Tax=Roseomonas sp. CCTCC AB2023176 TaxID=3342640 RepID=UPI0035DE3045